ncbi:MAG TPA: hypothetical protein VGK35_06110 [Actinotalea sp.]
MLDDADDFSPWTSAGASSMREAADDLVQALNAHVAAVTAVQGHEGTADVIAAGARLVPALLAYADAQFDYSGTWYPFGALVAGEDDDDPTDATT